MSARVTLPDEEKSAEVMPATWRLGGRGGKSRGQHPAIKAVNHEYYRYFQRENSILLITYRGKNNLTKCQFTSMS